MKVGSLFAGIGGFDLGFHRAGFDVAWAAEWDKHAQNVLRRRFPGTTVYGDIREIDLERLEQVDVICGGFPCQDLSVAGKRAGLAGERSGLFHDAMRIVRRLRPSVLVLENVPGLLSSNHGLDFATVLREVGEGWDCAEVAWRVLDSQFFGVAQRRRRVFIVAVRDPRVGCAEEILALASSGGGNPPAKREARQGSASDAARCPDGGRWWDGSDISASMTTRCHDQFMPDKGNFAAVVQGYRWQTQKDGLVADDVVGLRASTGSSGFHEMNHPVVAQTNYVAFTIDMQACKGNANVGDGSVSPTLCKPSGNDCHAVAIGMDAEFNARMEQMGTLKRGGEGGRAECVAIGVDVYNGMETGDVAATVTSATGIANASGPKAIAFNWQNGGGYGNANDGLGITEEGTGPLQRCQTPAVAVSFDWQKGNDVNNPRASTMNVSVEQTQTLSTTRLPAVAFSCKDHGADASAVAPTLRAMPHSGSHANGGGQVAVAFYSKEGSHGSGDALELSHPLKVGSPAAVAFAQNQVGEIRTSETMSTIGTTGNASARTTPKIMSGMVVRRLTPVECERLQGFPDGWTDVGTPEKPTADSHRYKQLGNAVTVNVAEWLARRIRRCLEQ